MLRPPSATGSAQPNPLPSSQQVKPLTASNISLFLSNVRLLNLDKCADWPDVNAKTFDTKDAAQNQKKRISCVEWILFRLFQTLDPAMTKEKLQPFFPPLEPLQSINLRAALFRCFNDLKKSGVLGRNAVVRKTMLDECKGDKFEELLLTFSTLVLRQTILARGQKPHTVPIAQRLGMTDSIKSADVKTLLPLSLAHRASLSASLRHQAQRRRLLEAFHSATISERQRIRQQHEKIAVQNETESGLPGEVAESIRAEVQRNWAGPTEGSRLLLGGTMAATETSRAKLTYIESLECFQQSGLLPAQTTESTLLQRLQLTLREQDQRLAQWNDYEKSIKNCTRSVDEPGQLSSQIADNKAESLAFDEHQSVRIDAMTQAVPPLANNQSTLRYDNIISAMKRDISAVADRRVRKGSVPTRTQKRIPSRSNSSTQSSQMSAKSTASHIFGSDRVPVLRAASQRAKFDLFSPLKGGSEPNDSITSSPVGFSYPAPGSSDSKTPRGWEGRLTGADASSSKPARRVGEYEVEDAHEGSEQEVAKSSRKIDRDDESLRFSRQSIVQDSISSEPSPEMEPDTAPSLSERARMSIARSSEETSGLLPSISPFQPDPEERDTRIPVQPSLDRRVSLADRTRQSMSFVSFEPRTELKRRESKRETYPVNQFETPIKSTAAYLAPNQDALDCVATTPKDNLFSEDAEYASVFKSRPKIAVSPVLSPTDAESMTPLDYGRMDDLHDFGSSPLWRRR